MYRISDQYSCQYSYEYLSTCPWVRVQVRVLLLWNSRVEYEKVWVPEIQHLSTEYKYSSPAFDHTHDLALEVSRSESEIALSQEWVGLAAGVRQYFDTQADQKNSLVSGPPTDPAPTPPTVNFLQQSEQKVFLKN